MTKSYGGYKTLGELVTATCVKEYGTGVWYSAREVYRKLKEQHNITSTQETIASYVSEVNKANGLSRSYDKTVDHSLLQRRMKALKAVTEKYKLTYAVLDEILTVVKENGGVTGIRKTLNLLKAIE